MRLKFIKNVIKFFSILKVIKAKIVL